MHVLDPRLLRRARAARVLLVVDAVLGVVMALLVLAQAVLLARVAARSFEGASLEEVTTPLVLLVAVVAARSLAAWGFEVAGRRAAGDVISQLRLDVVETRLRRQPTALDGARSAEVATAAVSGVDALETTFARYLPQLVLAAVVPVAVLILVAAIDPLAAGVMLLTLPLVPVFMWLVGRHTERRARERWQALAVLSNHFLDVVRGLPTLRAFNRSRAQAARIEEVSDEYRRTTMGTLRVAFLSGSILELAATLGIALVAVVVGVRLAEGGIGFEPALTVLVLVPELYLPLRNLAAQFHASADGAAVAERLLELADARAGSHARDGSARSRARPDPVRKRLVRLPEPRSRRAARARPGDPSRRDDVDRRAEWRGEEHARLVAPPSRRSLGGPHRRRRRRPGGARRTRWRALTALVPQQPTLFRGTVAENIRLGAPAADDEQVRRAAELAGAHDFVARLPLSYATLVGDGGRQLSAGQRRRIALARAFLRDAPLVLLDEPTADLDAVSAELVAESIDRLRARRTVVIVAHAPELAASADRVVRLESGRVLKVTEKAA